MRACDEASRRCSEVGNDSICVTVGAGESVGRNRPTRRSEGERARTSAIESASLNCLVDTVGTSTPKLVTSLVSAPSCASRAPPSTSSSAIWRCTSTSLSSALLSSPLPPAPSPSGSRTTACCRTAARTSRRSACCATSSDGDRTDSVGRSLVCAAWRADGLRLCATRRSAGSVSSLLCRSGRARSQSWLVREGGEDPRATHPDLLEDLVLIEARETGAKVEVLVQAARRRLLLAAPLQTVRGGRQGCAGGEG